MGSWVYVFSFYFFLKWKYRHNSLDLWNSDIVRDGPGSETNNVRARWTNSRECFEDDFFKHILLWLFNNKRRKRVVLWLLWCWVMCGRTTQSLRSYMGATSNRRIHKQIPTLARAPSIRGNGWISIMPRTTDNISVKRKGDRRWPLFWIEKREPKQYQQD